MPERTKKGSGKSADRPENDAGNGARSHAIWSGTITFGLVSLPVDLFSAHRSATISLRMVDEDGTPLRRQYYCPRDDRALTRDEIVRGYEIGEDEYVVVTDDELEAIAPEKSREIDLRRFVAVDEIDPMYFERAYFLAPATESTKAYRLLAEAMEREGRAGIATFVMRGKEYLVALLSEGGILRAETLRFQEELRTPGDVGLPELGKAPAGRVSELTKAIESRQAKSLDRKALTDPSVGRIQALVKQKLRSRKQVVKAAKLPEEPESTADVIDLMAILKERLQGRAESSPARRKVADGEGRKGGARRAGGEDLERKSKQALYERAQALDIAGRSQMSKRELIKAIRQAQ